MKKKQIKIGLIPSDFIDSKFGSVRDCPLARAIKRHFGIDRVLVTISFVIINTPLTKELIIKDKFFVEDYKYVKEQYEKDPDMVEVQYEVTLIEEQ